MKLIHSEKIFIIKWDEYKDSRMTIDANTLSNVLNSNIAGCNNIIVSEIKQEKQNEK